MLYLFALIGVVAVGVLLWRLLSADRMHVGATGRPSVAPDDDPEFLRRLGEQTRRTDDDG